MLAELAPLDLAPEDRRTFDELARQLARFRDKKVDEQRRAAPTRRRPWSRKRAVEPTTGTPSEEYRTRGAYALEQVIDCILANVPGAGPELRPYAEQVLGQALKYLDELHALDFGQELVAVERAARADGLRTGLLQLQLGDLGRRVDQAERSDELEPLVDIGQRLEAVLRLLTTLRLRRLWTAPPARLVDLIEHHHRIGADPVSSSSASRRAPAWDLPPPGELGPPQPITAHAPPARGSCGGHELARRVRGGVTMPDD